MYQIILCIIGGAIVYIRKLIDYETEDNAGSMAILEAGQQETSEGLLQCYQETHWYGNYGQEDTR